MFKKLYQLTVTWPSTDAAHVTVTGTFDNWSQSVAMQKLPEGGFIAYVDVPWDTTVFFKFVEDGNWLIDTKQPHCDDGTGQINNFYKTPKAPEPAPTPSAVTADKTEVSPITDKVEPQLAAIGEPEVIVADHVNDTAEGALTVPAAPVPAEADIVPLAAAVERPTDVVPETSAGSGTQTDPPAPSLPIIEVLPSTDALPTTMLVEPATSEPPTTAAVEPEAPPLGTTLTPAAESSATAVADSAHETAQKTAGTSCAPAAEVALAPASPAVDDIVYATANTDATADAVVAAAKVTDLVPPAITEETPVKADSTLADDETTTATESISEKPAKTLAEIPEATKAPAAETVVKPETTKITAVETPSNATPRPENKGSANADRRSRTYTSFKDKLFPSLDHEKTHGVSEDGTVQPPSPTGTPPREKRKSIFGRVVGIFKPSS